MKLVLKRRSFDESAVRRDKEGVGLTLSLKRHSFDESRVRRDEDGQFADAPGRGDVDALDAFAPARFVKNGDGSSTYADLESNGESVTQPKRGKLDVLSPQEERARWGWVNAKWQERAAKALRNGEPAPKADESVRPAWNADDGDYFEALDAAIAKSAFRNNVTLWRGLALTDEQFSQLGVGDVMKDKSYLSVSLNEDMAAMFGRTRAETVPGAKGRVLRILAPSGTNATVGLDLMQEAILPREMSLRIVEISGDTIVVIIEGEEHRVH